MKTKLILPLCGFLVSITSPAVMAEDDRASIMVFDASGSMWGQLKDGRTKIDVAKEVIGGYLKDRDQSTPLGIIAYGHNRKGDCSDIEVIAAVGKQDSSALASSINKIKPKGKTPLTDALELAVKQIPKTAEEADIILITDGLETCDRDPCALAQKIADEGINIRAHVVGFGLSEKEVNSLSCIPEKTGGQLLRPQTGSELSDALKQVEKKPTEPVTLPISISLEYEAGTARPTSISYSAKNIETNEVVNLGKTNDTVEIVRGFNTELLKGKWLLMAKGPQGSGELEITTKSGERYLIPYAAEKADFSLLNYGPYQLGQGQSFLLELGKPMQKNLTLTAELFPASATSSKDRIEHEYLIGVDKGIHEIDFKSPSKAGKYKIIIGKSFEEQVASFDIEFVDDAKPNLKISDNVKPNEKFAYELYGNWYRNNKLLITRNGKEISSTWLQYTIEKDGTYLTAPDKDGTYDILLRYTDASGKSITTKLVELQVGESAKDSDTPQADTEPNKKSENKNTESSVFKPASTLIGEWSLTNLNIGDDEIPKALLNANITSEQDGSATSETIQLSSDFLGMEVTNDSLQITPAGDDVDGKPTVELSFSTEKGKYQGQLSYHPTHFDERLEAWGGALLLDGKEVAVVLFKNNTLTKTYQDHPPVAMDTDIVLSENKNETEATNPYAAMQGKWELESQSDLLIRLIVSGKKGDRPAGAYYSMYDESADYLGAKIHEDEVLIKKEHESLSFTFNTLKGHYDVKLAQNNNEDFFKSFWTGVTPSFDRELWVGSLQLKGKPELIPVYLQKMVESSSDASPKPKTSILYDLDKSADELVFTCQQASCTYDDKNTGLKGIPLIDGWAIEEPYFYTTAAGVKADVPTLTFVNTKTGAWFILNPRQATDAMFECTEFGKDGRLSSEEKVCIPNGIPDDALGNIVTLQENVEFWRTASYEEKEDVSSVSRASIGNVMSAEDIADFRKKMGMEK